MTLLEIIEIWQRIHSLTLICPLSLFLFYHWLRFFSQLPQRALLRRYDSWFMDPPNDYFLVQTTQLVINSMYVFIWVLAVIYLKFWQFVWERKLISCPMEIFSWDTATATMFWSKVCQQVIFDVNPCTLPCLKQDDAITDRPHRRNFKIFNPFLFKARRKDSTSLKS